MHLYTRHLMYMPTDWHCSRTCCRSVFAFGVLRRPVTYWLARDQWYMRKKSQANCVERSEFEIITISAKLGITKKDERKLEGEESR